jgi:hypothetical protein
MFLYVFNSFGLGSKEMDELGHLDESMTLSAFGPQLKTNSRSRPKAYGRHLDIGTQTSEYAGLVQKSIFRKPLLPNRGNTTQRADVYDYRTNVMWLCSQALKDICRFPSRLQLSSNSLASHWPTVRPKAKG